MEQYKPGYLGKVIPADNSSKMNDFMINKFDSFSKIYDTCKNQSGNISDIKVVDNGGDPNTLSVKVSTDKNTISSIMESVKDNPNVTINNDVITAKA